MEVEWYTCLHHSLSRMRQVSLITYSHFLTLLKVQEYTLSVTSIVSPIFFRQCHSLNLELVANPWDPPAVLRSQKSLFICLPFYLSPGDMNLGPHGSE